MKPETAFWNFLQPRLKHHGCFERVENLTMRGMPDVSFTLQGVDGWIELKALDEWPVRTSTIVRVDHFTPQQRIWHQRRAFYGGRTFVFLRVGRGEYLLFRGDVAARLLGLVPRARLVSAARWHSAQFNIEELCAALTAPLLSEGPALSSFTD